VYTSPIVLRPAQLDLSNVITMPVKKRTVKIGGHNTSISVEDPFWFMLKSLAARQQMYLCELLSRIDSHLEDCENLSSACRLFVLASMQAQIAFLKQGPGDATDAAPNNLTVEQWKSHSYLERLLRPE
jgi:predicted DNA-binding ribbon-helix-helix protein